MKKIAVIRRNRLGDLLCSFPLLLLLREREPGARLTLFVDESNVSLLRYLPQVADEVVVFPKGGNKYWNLFKIALRFRMRGFDWAISAKTSPMKLMNLFLFFLGAKRRFAAVDGKWHGRLVNMPTLYEGVQARTLHQALKGIQLVYPEITALPAHLHPRLEVPAMAQLDLQGPILFLSGSSNRETSRFCPKRTSALLNRLFETHFFSVVSVAMPGDERHAEALCDGLRAPHRTLIPSDFDAFIKVLAACDAIFVGDGGVAHLAAGLGKRQLVLFGGTLPSEWAPMGDLARVLFHPKHVNEIPDEEILLELKRAICACKDAPDA